MVLQDVLKVDAGEPAAEKEPTTVLARPFLSLRIESENVPMAVYVNGGLVRMDESAHNASETWPVNHLARLGDNDIQVRVHPFVDDNDVLVGFKDARVTVSLLVRDAAVEGAPDVEIATLRFAATGTELPSTDSVAASTRPGSYDSQRQFEAVTTGDVVIQPVTITPLEPGGAAALLVQTVRLPYWFPEWKFLQGPLGPMTYELDEEHCAAIYHEVFKGYEEVYTLLKARDWKRLMPLFEERCRELDQALYQPAGTTLDKLRFAFEYALDNHDVKLMPVRTDKGEFWEFDIGPSGRLFTIGRDSRMSPLIRFQNKKHPGLATVFAMSFRKQGDRFVVSR